MEAVNNENENNLLSDLWRRAQVLRSTSNPRHPFSKYGTGNLQTLRDSPVAAGVDVRQALLGFHKEHYCASRMNLVVVGKGDVLLHDLHEF